MSDGLYCQNPQNFDNQTLSLVSETSIQYHSQTAKKAVTFVINTCILILDDLIDTHLSIIFQVVLLVKYNIISALGGFLPHIITSSTVFGHVSAIKKYSLMSIQISLAIKLTIINHLLQ